METPPPRTRGARLDGGGLRALEGLETEAVIDDFEVRQLQAVRNY